jgi:hypothetical protein
MDVGTIPPRAPGLFEPQTVQECSEMHLGVASVEDECFEKVTSATFSAYVLDRFFSLFRPDDRDRKLQVASC